MVNKYDSKGKPQFALINYHNYVHLIVWVALVRAIEPLFGILSDLFPIGGYRYCPIAIITMVRIDTIT